MSRYLSHIRVFVASPGDVANEAKKLYDVVDELNRTWSDELGTHLDLIRWDRDVCPGVGEDPQDVINKEIDKYSYDIFIGIMWKRLGTATIRADSGTIEEYDIAYERYRKDPNQIKIMFYFKKILPSERSEIDVCELDKINKFKTKLKMHNLCCIYEDVDEFEKLIRQHLSKQLQGWQKSWGKKPAKLRYKYNTPIGWMKEDPDVGEDFNSTILTDGRAEIRIDIIRLSNSELNQIAKRQFVEDDPDLSVEIPYWITTYRENPWGISEGLWSYYKNYLTKLDLKPREISGGGDSGLLRPDGANAFYATNYQHYGLPSSLPIEWYFVWIRPEYGNIFVGIRAQFPPKYFCIHDMKIVGREGCAHVDSFGGGAYANIYLPEPLWMVISSFTTSKYDD